MTDRGKIQQPRRADLPVSERAYDAQVEQNRQEAARSSFKNRQKRLKQRRITQQENFDRVTRQINEAFREGKKQLAGSSFPLQRSLRGDKLQTGFLDQDQKTKQRPKKRAVP